MLFLLNDQVLDVAVEIQALGAEFAAGRRAPTLYQAVSLGQQVIFAGGGFHHVHPSAARRVAALIAMTSEANAALFVRPEAATEPAQVAVRLAAAPLMTLSRLNDFQKQGALSAGQVNAHVWSLASKASAA